MMTITASGAGCTSDPHASGFGDVCASGAESVRKREKWKSVVGTGQKVVKWRVVKRAARVEGEKSDGSDVQVDLL
jgi:hypothetical protein